jgi:hypothetical protein
MASIVCVFDSVISSRSFFIDHEPRHVISLGIAHFSLSPLLFCLRLEPELDQAADGFGAI